MPLKNFLVKCNAFINIKLFNISPEKAVIYGKDGWLFYNSKNKEETDTLGDFLNYELMNEAKLEECKNVLVSMQQACERNGAQFIFMVAPNKMTVYGDKFMPDVYKREGTSTKADILVDYLRNNTDIRIVYPKDELMKHKDALQVYYKLDSHWNELGGYIGYRDLYEKMFAQKLPKVEEITYEEEQIHTGDLARMLKIDIMDDMNYNVDYKTEIEVERQQFDGGFYSISNHPAQNKILMFRDSYALAIEKYIIKDFTWARLNWQPNFDEALVKEEKPDVVVYQVVERSLFNLPQIEHHFMIELTETDEYYKGNVPQHSDEEIVGYCIAEETEKELKINGFSFVVGEDSKEIEARVILVGEDISYEASLDLMYREDVEEAYDTYEKIGYSGIKANLDLSSVKKGSYDVYVIFENQGKSYFENLNYKLH